MHNKDKACPDCTGTGCCWDGDDALCALRAENESLKAVIKAARECLESLGDRMDEFTYQEMDSVLEEQ